MLSCSSPWSFGLEWNPLALAATSACSVNPTLLQRGLIVYMWFDGGLFVSPVLGSDSHCSREDIYRTGSHHMPQIACRISSGFYERSEYSVSAGEPKAGSESHWAHFTILPSVKGSHVSPRLRVYCDWQNRDSSIVIVGKYETWLRSFRVFVLFCSAEKNPPSRWGSCGDFTAFGTNRIWRFFINQVVVTARFTQNLIITLALHPSVSLTLRFVSFLIQLSAWPLDLFLFSCFCFFFRTVNL